MKTAVFVKKSRFNAPVQDLFQWHARPGALERLSPPWDPLEVVRKDPGLDVGTHAIMKIRAGFLPLKIKWVAEHTTCSENRLFRDKQLKGPFRHWIHTHTFTPDGDACFLEDRIEYALPFPPLGPALGNTFIHGKLRRIFRFRHATLARDLADHVRHRDHRPLNILISGASGIVGSALIPFLTTGGHRPVCLIRDKSKTVKDDIFWDPEAGYIDRSRLNEIDVAIHLSGENIGQGHWTSKKKKKIIQSRNRSTRLLAKSLADMATPPKTLICASAIGFYGDRGDELLTEESECGPDFISGVCSEWEASATPAIDKGIRVVFLRIGVVLTPLGGALKRLLFPFQLGLGGKIGSGDQYISWVAIDDLIGAIYHAIYEDSLHGPVNIVSPNPVTNAELTETLGRVLRRPAMFPIPAGIINMLFGQMGREILLASTRVEPGKLVESNYRFRHAKLEAALRHLLGK
jgi:uncharacterized protein (TIGR01777 family)